MTDPFSWSVPLFRLPGLAVRAHAYLLIFLGLELVDVALTRGFPLPQRAAWLLLLFVALLIHLLGQSLAAEWLSGDADEPVLWPLGVFHAPTISFAPKSFEAHATIAAGPLLNLIVALVTAIGLNIAGAQMIFNPFGNSLGGGAPILHSDGKTLASAFTPLWYFGWFGWLNWVLFTANLVPALPLAGGRFVRGWTDGPSRDGLVGPMLARAFAMILGVGGLLRVVLGYNNGWPLLALAITVWLVARFESRMLEEGGYLEDHPFGYDFSQGYKAFEPGAATVRPHREGALRRWRRRRSELRRQRRYAREAAEEKRMDEILAKVHLEGRSSLSDDENRFLLRVSARYKNKPRGRE